MAHGVKTIETRSRRTLYRGRIALHATARRAGSTTVLGDPAQAACYHALLDHRLQHGPLARGAIVGSAHIVDCVPMYRPGNDPEPNGKRLAIGPEYLMLETPSEGGGTVQRFTDQLPFGLFTPGRWAILLEDAKPTSDRCPWCWGDGMGLTEHPGALELDQSPLEAWGYGCRVCEGAGKCDPVPAKGQQGFPWEWTP